MYCTCTNVLKHAASIIKSFTSHKAHRAALISVSLTVDTSLHCKTTYTALVIISYDVPVHTAAFTGAHYAYPWRDGQAELTWVAGYILRWFTCLLKVTHLSTNQVQRRLTLSATNDINYHQLIHMLYNKLWTINHYTVNIPSCLIHAAEYACSNQK